MWKMKCHVKYKHSMTCFPVNCSGTSTCGCYSFNMENMLQTCILRNLSFCLHVYESSVSLLKARPVPISLKNNILSSIKTCFCVLQIFMKTIMRKSSINICSLVSHVWIRIFFNIQYIYNIYTVYICLNNGTGSSNHMTYNIWYCYVLKYLLNHLWIAKWISL